MEIKLSTEIHFQMLRKANLYLIQCSNEASDINEGY